MDASIPDGVSQLCDRLRTERLLVSSEVDSLRGLHSSIEQKLISLGLNSWNNHQHLSVLHRLLGSHILVTPENASSICSQLDSAHIVEAHRRLGHHHSSIARFLSLLSHSPRAVAHILHSADSSAGISSEDVVHSVFSLVYGNAIYPLDEKALLETLSHLIRLQLMTSPDPRLSLRKGTAVFPRLYRMFSETLFTSKIFLTAALHDSVMLVLCQDEIFLDIDPAKSPLRFPASERTRRFGDDVTSPAYHKKVAAHRKYIVEKLVLLAHNFIKGVSDAMTSFPSSLIWLVQQLHSTLMEHDGLDESRATLICTDLIVTSLLCPAITNPETMGVVSDTPISHIARFNLMQIGQIVQTLALSRHETPPPHFQLFANQFRDSPICSLVDSLLSRPSPQLDVLFPIVLAHSGLSDDSTHKSSGGATELFRRRHFIGSLAQVNTLVKCFHLGLLSSVTPPTLRDELTSTCQRLPMSFESPASTTHHDESVNSSPNQSRQSRLKDFADKVQTSLHSSSHSPSRGGPAHSPGGQQSNLPAEYYDVIVFQMDEQGDPLGLTPEDSFMELVAKETRKGEGRGKRARFVDTSSTVGSAISDRTTDNASDLEEEAAEQDEVGSVSSSQEAPQEDRMLLLDEDNASTLPDNVSDVGGMSGRGSPSLSGRDTPLSQANRDGDGAEHAEHEAYVVASSTAAGGGVALALSDRHLPPVPVAVRKQNAEGLEEKFGKFTVPMADQNRPYRDDQRSLLSDSWSTNVVASDDEANAPSLPQPPEDPNRLQRPVNRTGSIGGGGVGGSEDRSDTWSLDAIASDSEEREGRDDESRREMRRQRRDAEMQLSGGALGVAGGVGRGVARRTGAAPYRELSVDGQPPLIDLSDPAAPPLPPPRVVPPGDMEEQGERVRRRSSGSSFSYSRSDAGSERDSLGVALSLPPSDDRPRPPAVPTRPPMRRGGSVEQPGPSSRISSAGNSPSHRNTLPFGRTPPDSPGAPSLAPSLGGSAPFGSANETPSTGKKKLALFQGLQRVGDKMRKGMANSSLRQIPHSSTLSDLLGEFGGGSAAVSRGRETGGGRMPESRSENRITDLDPRSADDILAKYQRASPGTNGSPSVAADVLIDIASSSSTPPHPPHHHMTPPTIQAPPPPSGQDIAPYYSSENITECRAFLDAKRKLRLVLGSVGSAGGAVDIGLTERTSERDQLLSLLRSLLAEAINGRQQVMCAHIRETIRCLQVFDGKGVRKLLRSLREEQRRRSSYVSYLQQSRITLLRLSNYIDKLASRIQREKTLSEECLVDVLIRFYLEHKEGLVRKFLHEFAMLKMQDEKTECLSATLASLFSRLPQSPMWNEAPDTMRQLAMTSLERVVMGQIHAVAFYPNMEADRHRDEVLYRALSKLSRYISPDHPMMRIPVVLHGEAPWPSAQAEISIINAYRSARDKLACVVRCCETISNLVSMAPGMGAAAADDVTPVLVYVLIQANPPALLSNVQYVESFGQQLLAGAEGYWWTQFTAAIEFVKTLL